MFATVPACCALKRTVWTRIRLVAPEHVLSFDMVLQPGWRLGNVFTVRALVLGSLVCPPRVGVEVSRRPESLPAQLTCVVFSSSMSVHVFGHPRLHQGCVVAVRTFDLLAFVK